MGKIFLYWIPRPYTFRPFSPHTLPSDTTVAKLLSADGGWNVELIRQHFLPSDAAEILQIPLPTVHTRDKTLWHFNRNGVYSVKSGYHVALTLRFPDFPSGSESLASWWKFIWYLPALPKMKIFFWRALQDILPTQSNSARRKISTNEICQRCDACVEDAFHSLIACKYARKDWKLKPCFSWIASSAHMSFSCLAKKGSVILSKDVFVSFVGVAWSIWKARNKALYGCSREDSHQVLNRVEILLGSSTAGLLGKSAACQNAAPQPEKWHHLDPPWYKLNTDAAVEKEGGFAGLGSTIRNSEGAVMAAAITKKPCLGDAHIGEALAILEGMRMAANLALAPLIIESDSKNVINSILKGSFCRASWIG